MFRQMRRSNQLLSREKCDEVLAGARRGVISVAGDDGYPYGIPINFVYIPSKGPFGALYFHTALAGHKVDAIATCDKVSFCTMDEGYHENPGEWWFYVNSVVCFGRAHIVEDPAAKHDALVALAQKYFPPSVDIEADIAKNGDRIHMVEVAIEHMTGKIVQEK